MVEPPKITPEDLNTDLVKTIQKLQRQIKKLEGKLREKDLDNQKLKDKFITLTDLIQTTNKNNTTQPSSKEDANKKQISYAKATNNKTTINIKPNANEIDTIVKRLNTHPPEQPTEFAVLHIEFNNNKDIAMLVKARNFEKINIILKKQLEYYDIQNFVIKFSRIGKSILEIYIDKKNKDEVEARVYNAGGHFDEDFKPGEIDPKTLETLTNDQAQFIARSIQQRATRQYLAAPTLNFKKCVIENYKGQFEEQIKKMILDEKEKRVPAPKGTTWAWQGYGLIQKKKTTKPLKDMEYMEIVNLIENNETPNQSNTVNETSTHSNTVNNIGNVQILKRAPPSDSDEETTTTKKIINRAGTAPTRL